MNYLDLFHGIGGFALGAYWAGMKFENHYCSDIEPYTQELYKLRFPESIQLGDITKIDTSKLPTGDWIITGGFPCQDISIAGKGAGIHGERSGLWFEYWRIISELRPRIAIMENVGALTNWFDVERRFPAGLPDMEGREWGVEIDQYQAIATVIGNLSEIGYNAEWQDIRASDVGAPHRRERIWIVAYPIEQGAWHLRGEIRANNRRETGWNESTFRQGNWQNGTNRIKPTSESEGDVAYTSGKRRTTRDDNEREYENNISKIRKTEKNKQSWSFRERRSCEVCENTREIPDTSMQRLEREESERSRPGEQGLSPECNTGYWSIEPAVGVLVDGVSTKLDGGLNNAKMESAESCAAGVSENGEMRMVRENEKPTAASPGHKKGNGNNNIMPGVSCESRSNARDTENKTITAMRSMQEMVYSTGQPQAQDLRIKLSENPWERKRIEAVAWQSEPDTPRLATGVKRRVDRLKGLGNAIVPQIAQLLFEQIKPLLQD